MLREKKNMVPTSGKDSAVKKLMYKFGNRSEKASQKLLVRGWLEKLKKTTTKIYP